MTVYCLLNTAPASLNFNRSSFSVKRLAKAGAMRKEIREFKDVKDKRLRLLQQLRATCCLRTRAASLRAL